MVTLKGQRLKKFTFRDCTAGQLFFLITKLLCANDHQYDKMRNGHSTTTMLPGQKLKFTHSCMLRQGV